MKKKIVLLGGGSLYFESVLAELATTQKLPHLDVVLYDINARRMDLIHRVGQRVAAKTGADMTIGQTTQLPRALDGADFAIASIGVHGPNALWHKRDSDVAARFGIIQTTGDTVGPSGLSQALRIIPIFHHIGQAMEKYCPDAILLNHSNPMSPICRSIRKHTSINVIGYCHNVLHGHRYLAKTLEVKPSELRLVVAGTNHMVWLLEACHHGKDAYPMLRTKLKPVQGHRFAKEVMDLFGLFPFGGDRHLVEFFPHSRRASRTKGIPYHLKWRSDMISEALLQKEISHGPEDIELKAAGKRGVWLPKGEEGSPEAMGQQILAMIGGPELLHYINTPNRGAVTNLPDWAVIEMKAVVGAGGARPIAIGELPPQAARWTLAQIYAHELTVDAAIEGSREKALQALACDPMILNFDEARKVFDAIVKDQGERLRVFRPK